MRSKVQFDVGEVVFVRKYRQTGIVLESYMALDPLVPFRRVYVVSISHEKVRILWENDLQRYS